MKTLASLVLALLLALGAYAQESPGELGKAHRDNECGDCHAKTDRPDPQKCGECHFIEMHLHPTAIAPSFKLAPGLGDGEGNLWCGSCHQLHKNTSYKNLRGLESEGRANLTDFCAGCHKDPLAMKNPHRAVVGTNRCLTCHPPIDAEAVLQGKRPVLRASTDHLCNFCHDQRGKNHPRNIDPTLKLPENLPREKNGEIGCHTCHEPHGSTRYTHYIREEYAANYEREKGTTPHLPDKDACALCHTSSHNFEITRADHELRFSGDHLMLCLSCHPRARAHHPVGITLDRQMSGRLRSKGGLPLGKEEIITCITCHTTNCDRETYKIATRDYRKNPPDFALCWKCHDREQQATQNPHAENVAKGEDDPRCLICHEKVPTRGHDKPEEMYFVSSINMMCLRCHENYSVGTFMHGRNNAAPKPAMLERIKALEEEKGIRLPLEINGTVECTTCHSAHFDKSLGGKRVRLPLMELCRVCHNR